MTADKQKKLLWQVPLLAVLIIGTIIIAHEQRNTPYQTNTGLVFGTIYNISYQSKENLQSVIDAELSKVDSHFSMFNDTSLTARINNGEQVVADSMFADMFALAKAVHADTDGAFDPTVGNLVNVWGFGFKSGEKPTRNMVDSLLESVGLQHIELRESDGRLLVEKDADEVVLDFSAIAKGYGCECVARLLRSHGVENFMVEIGGEVVTSGVSQRRLPWRIGVVKPSDDPLATSEEMQTVLNVTDISMATSGNYRNFYYEGGRKYAHTIDPSTGFPVQHSLLSATVLCSNCALADAYATSFMVMGIEKAKAVLKRHPEMMAYFIYADSDGSNPVWFSPSLKDRLAD